MFYLQPNESQSWNLGSAPAKDVQICADGSITASDMPSLRLAFKLIDLGLWTKEYGEKQR